MSGIVTGLQDVYVNVASMGRALAFYRDTLGLTVTDESEHFTGLEVGGVRIGLHWTGGSSVPYVPRDAHGAHAGATITFRVDNIKSARTMMEKAGVPLLGHSENPWGNILVIEDPDGNVIKLMAPPSDE